MDDFEYIDPLLMMMILKMLMISFSDNDDDDEDDRNRTTPFQPHNYSTPGPSGEEIPVTTISRGQEKGSKHVETSFIEGNTTNSRVSTSNEMAWDSLTKIYTGEKALELELP